VGSNMGDAKANGIKRTRGGLEKDAVVDPMSQQTGLSYVDKGPGVRSQISVLRSRFSKAFAKDTPKGKKAQGRTAKDEERSRDLQGGKALP